jgi:hypothetical protein
VVFSDGQRQQQFTLSVTDDLVAELLEVFVVQLVNSTVGASITPADSAASITVQASDHPYGRFVFSPAVRPLEGVSESGRVEVVVLREFGLVGEVAVEVQTVSSAGITANSVLTSLLDVQALSANSQIATTNEDYDNTTETLVFANGETSRSFYINIIEDSTPELDEYIFAIITQVELNRESLVSVDTSVLPSVVAGNESLAILVIAENDDARGVVQFVDAALTTLEPSQDFVMVQRSAGRFGNLTVQWQATPGTADSADYTPRGGVVIIPADVQVVALPLTVLDDNEPEFSEEFVVRLLSVSGGGRLGGSDSSIISIEANDDPNGAFGKKLFFSLISC